MNKETKEGEMEGAETVGERKRGQLLLKDEPRSQSCLCHMILGARLSGKASRLLRGS